MKAITKLLLLAGVGGVIYAATRKGGAEGGDTLEPPGPPPDLPDPPEAQWEPAPEGNQPGIMPDRGPGGMVME